MPTTKPPETPLVSSNHLPVAAVVLAAGLSRRMGAQNKLLEPVRGLPMVRRVVEHVLASQCDRVLVVLGHEADKVRAVLSDLPVQFLDNPNFNEGLAAAVRTGAAHARAGEALMVCLGDMPRVRAPVLNRLIEAYRDQPDRMAWQPVYGGKRGNPVLWSPAAVPDLAGLKGDEGARSLLKKHADKVQMVSVDTDGISLDIDTPEALRQLQQEKLSRT